MKKVQSKLILGFLGVIAITLIILIINFFYNTSITKNFVKENSHYYPYNDVIEFYHSCIKECPQDYPDYINEKCWKVCVESLTKKFPEFENVDGSDDSLMQNLDRGNYIKQNCIFYQCLKNTNNKIDVPPEMRLIYSCVQNCLK